MFKKLAKYILREELEELESEITRTSMEHLKALKERNEEVRNVSYHKAAHNRIKISYDLLEHCFDKVLNNLRNVTVQESVVAEIRWAHDPIEFKCATDLKVEKFYDPSSSSRIFKDGEDVSFNTVRINYKAGVYMVDGDLVDRAKEDVILAKSLASEAAYKMTKQLQPVLEREVLKQMNWTIDKLEM